MVFNRQRLTLSVEGQAKPVVLADEKKTLADYGVSEGAKLRLKDLGPQVAYRWLYLWEYVSFADLNTTRDEADSKGRSDLPQPRSVLVIPD
jgi:very-long-chain enoyl-CoA reductase